MRRGRNTIHFSSESGTLDCFHSANQHSIYGAVSSWCDELGEQMPGQTSMGVDKSISKVDEQVTKHLDPQEVGSLRQNQTRTEAAAGNYTTEPVMT